MSTIGGYQSDIAFSQLTGMDNLPAGNMRGGYGVTTGTTDDYDLSLDPPLTTYGKGLPLYVRFNHANTRQITINVDGLGARAVKKIKDRKLVPLSSGEINPNRVYHLVYEGTVFQVISTEQHSIPTSSANTPGLIALATKEETLKGTNNGKAVPPLHLQSKITGLVATDKEAIAGTMTGKFITPHSLQAFYQAQPKGDGRVYLFKNMGTFSEGITNITTEIPILPGYSLSGGVLTGNQGLGITMHGDLRNRLQGNDPGQRIVRMYLGDEMILSSNNDLLIKGEWTIQVIVYRINNQILKGYGVFHVNHYPSIVQFIQTQNLNINTDIPIVLTLQNPTGDTGQGAIIDRFSFIIEKLP